eukprot:CAMPEP_0174847068 /NCGR_PEP_ID=MMETSP1114-20130205/12693_1 /TAXON_ID=312471 /ORGANISM="Neobodo designis, Strain CCAP 1951/1" /LENGTH=173 /DNA_ID=CAMNT_0016081339 /DNA_START=35 /DNA_END=556 /DNA_ORIENTATION=-
MYQHASSFDRQPVAGAGMQHYDRRPWWEKQNGHDAMGITAEEAAEIAMQRLELIHQNATQCHVDRMRIARKAGRVGGRIPTPSFLGPTPAASRLVRAIVDEETPKLRPADAFDAAETVAQATADSNPHDFDATTGRRVVRGTHRPLSVAELAATAKPNARERPNMAGRHFGGQ